MKPAVVFIIAFVVATAASAGAKVALTKPTHPAGAPGDSSKTKGDSTTTDTAAVTGGAPGTPQSDSAHAVAAAADTSHAPATALPAASSTKPAAMTVPKPPAIGGPALQAGSTPRTTAAAQVPDTSSERRVAKVFTSMDPKQAAKVLEHMADPDIQIILGYVGTRQAAAIMAALPPERVATLSKLAMQGGGKK